MEAAHSTFGSAEDDELLNHKVFGFLTPDVAENLLQENARQGTH